MKFQQSVTDLIKRRFSCRTYRDQPVDPALLQELQDWFEAIGPGPFREKPDLVLVAAQPDDASALSGLGTYGFIKNPAGFLIGKTTNQPNHLLDYGYVIEAVILKATELELGTCWLGGTFNRSRFAQEIDLQEEEIIPAVVSLGLIAKEPVWIDPAIRATAGADQRLPWKNLFFADRFGRSLNPEQAGPYQLPLEMVRLGPSASNKQPWRVLKKEDRYHFYLKRTPGYPRKIFNLVLNLADLQRVDLGIALAHFELTCREQSLPGRWIQEDPELEPPEETTEYIASWVIH